MRDGRLLSTPFRTRGHVARHSDRRWGEQEWLERTGDAKACTYTHN